MTRVHSGLWRRWRAQAVVPFVLLASVGISALGSAPAGGDPTPGVPTVPTPLATSIHSGAGTWVTLPMGNLSQPLNTFWQLFFQPTGTTFMVGQGQGHRRRHQWRSGVGVSRRSAVRGRCATFAPAALLPAHLHRRWGASRGPMDCSRRVGGQPWCAVDSIERPVARPRGRRTRCSGAREQQRSLEVEHPHHGPAPRVGERREGLRVGAR